MLRAIRVAVPVVVVLGSIAACSGAGQPQEDLGSSEQELMRLGLYDQPPTTITTDSGRTDTATTDTAKADTGILVKSFDPIYMDPGTSVGSCAPTRYDITTNLRNCSALAMTTSTGTWSVASIFPGAPAAVRDTHCAATWRGIYPTCAPPNVSALALNCKERKSKRLRSPECAADPTQCNVTATVATVTDAGSPPPSSCDSSYLIMPGGYVGGCDSCGFVSGGMLYISNPYDDVSLRTNVTTAGGGAEQLNVSIPGNTTTAVSVSSSYLDGWVFVWPVW
jgi:hypothetical protein